MYKSLFILLGLLVLSFVTEAQVMSRVEREAHERKAYVNYIIQLLGPARDQKDTQLCFAHAGADIATFYTGQRISALSVAFRNFQFRQGIDLIFFNPAVSVVSSFGDMSRFMVGLGSSTLNTNLKASLCEDDQQEGLLSYRDHNLKKLWDVYHHNYRSYYGFVEPTWLYDNIRSEVQHLAPGLSAQDFIENLSRFKPLEKAMGEWFDRQCDIRLPSTLKVRGAELPRQSAEDLLSELKRAVKKGIPVIIHYDPGVLLSNQPEWRQLLVGFHVSTILGSTESEKGELFLLRNTWGSLCGHYSPEIVERCDRGHVWLTEEEIKNFVTSVAYYED